jgi:hypothetical protein
MDGSEASVFPTEICEHLRAQRVLSPVRWPAFARMNVEKEFSPTPRKRIEEARAR